MKKMALILAIAALSSTLAGCNHHVSLSPSNTITHPQGTTEVHLNPANPVIFDFGTLDTMDALGVTGATCLTKTGLTKIGLAKIGLAKKSIPSYLAQYNNDNVTNVGNMKQPDMQAVRDLKPQLIVITGRQSKSYEELSRIAPTINMSIDSKDYLNSFKKNVLTIGQIFDKTPVAESRLADLDKKIADLKTKAVASGKTAMVLVHYNGKLSASTTNGYAAIIHQVLGVKKADANQQEARQPATPEYIAAKNPDIIYIVDRNEAIGDGKIDHKLMEEKKIKKTSAYRNGKIIYLKPDLWYLSGGGLESLSLQLDEASSAL
ncbi:MAG: ABC transporter substrate-binding protein [Enterobacteriaceae bacterium]|jgi:iron complex transport system substrate-binding protein|nr:ABC transporter substrate-binding protein [Enterobacteriaceae bacterium]